MADLESVLREMRAHPLDFLRHYKVVIAGTGSGDGSGVAVFDFVDKSMTVPGFKTGVSGVLGMRGNREVIRFSWHKSDKGQCLELEANQFRAHYLAMMQVDSPDAIRYPLPGEGEPDIMLTSQLSGCSFGFGSETSSGVQLVSHVQPPRGAGEKAHALATEAASAAVRPGFEGVLQRPAGTWSYGSAFATVIGVRSGRRWHFYFQTSTHGAVLSARALN
jgi:hypothetical protein